MEWRPVVGYEGLYSVSNTGLVRSERRDRLLSLCVNQYGYLQTKLCCNGTTRTKLVHRLVATAFIENPESLPQINHIDECKINNRVTNLEWCTLEYNQVYGSVVKRRVGTHVRKNIAAKFSKPVVCCTKDGERLREYKSIRRAEAETGVYHKDISRCCRGRNKTAGGFKWAYAQT